MTECLAHILANARKSGVMDVKSYDGRVDTEVTRRNMQRCITWKKSQKGAKALDKAQKNVGLPCKKLITTFKTSFVYLINTLGSIIEIHVTPNTSMARWKISLTE